MKKASAPKDELLALRNVGPAIRADLALLGINTVEQLAREDALALHRRLEQVTGSRHDPCVIDVFLAAIHQARTGEATDWWEWTAARKQGRAARS